MNKITYTTKGAGKKGEQYGVYRRARGGRRGEDQQKDFWISANSIRGLISKPKGPLVWNCEACRNADR
ncbi:MAG TPA: hypothetical protein VLS90_07505 [Thermodesulfobacteriota bacterium]|nr:hypothetical protein [Thermodesulfobacteriota bacterium]